MRHFLLGFILVLALASGAFALSGDGGNLKVQNGKVVVTGTSGGIPFFSATDTLGTSAALTLNGVILGGGAGASPTATAAGAANTVFRVPGGGGAPVFGAVDLAQAAAVTGLLGLVNGGTNANLTAANGQVAYSTTTALALTTGGSTGNCLKFNSGSAPSWSACTTASTPIVAFGTLGDLLQNTAVEASINGNVEAVANEARVLTEYANSSSWLNLVCKSSVAAGTSQSYNVYLRRIQCSAASGPPAQTACAAATAPAAGDLQCIITGVSATDCAPDATHTISPAAKECLVWCINSTATAATAVINCTVERTA
jgi:hypothetical protein